MAMLATNADPKAATFSRVQARSAKSAALTTIASPNAMMMNPAQRSAMWPPSTAQDSTEEKPSPGVQKRAAGDTYSIPSAATQNHSRISPSAKPPSNQNTAEAHSHARMRMAL